MSAILKQLDDHYEAHGAEIENWLAARRQEHEPYVYNSVDLRHAGHRLVPVDTNLFPAGFNNLSPAAGRRTGLQLRDYIGRHFPHARRILLLPEHHTRNLRYLDNLAALKRCCEEAGFEVALGNFSLSGDAPLEVTSASGAMLQQWPLHREGKKVLSAAGFEADIILLNHDLTTGIPPLLEDIDQPVIPPPELGWHRRRKSRHFAAYSALIHEFGAHFSLDPWLFSAIFYQCGTVNFHERTGIDCVAKGVDCVIAQAHTKHAQYGITADPYVFVKADSGTYGMGIMTVRSGDEMLEMNKKERNKMQVIKEGAINSEVLIQEGIPTIDLVDGKPAEPMIYLVDGVPVGGMYRVNGARDALSNLNAAGMEFTGMCDEMETMGCDYVSVENCHFRAFGLIAAIAALAVPREATSKAS